MKSKHELVRQLTALPDWQPHGTCGPGTRSRCRAWTSPACRAGTRCWARMRTRASCWMRQALESADATRRWLEALVAWWRADGSRGDAIGEAGMRIVDGFLAPTFQLRRLVKGQIADDQQVLVQATRRPGSG